MKNGTRRGIVIAAFLAAFSVCGVAGAKLIYEELVTITLDDGTPVVLVMDDFGVQRPEQSAGASAVKQAKFDYLDRVRKAKGVAPAPPVTVVHAAPASTVQQQRYALAEKRLGIGKDLAVMRDHSKGKMLWAGTAGSEKHYYYLPPPPRVARDAEGRPQFLFMKFTSDRTAEQGGVTGGILHFLCEYGLTPEQERELGQKLAAKVKGAKVMGAVRMEQGSGDTTFQIHSGTMSEGGFAEKVVGSGKAPLLPGQKVAAAARLDAVGAVLIEESLKRPTSDISVEFDLAYTSFLPAFDGTITFDWQMFQAHVDEWMQGYQHTATRKGWNWAKARYDYEHVYTSEELRELYDFMCEHEAIRVEWTESIVDERLEAIREAFFRFMETSFFERQPFEMPEDDEESDEQMTSPEERGNRSRFDRFVAKGEEAMTNKTISMRVTLPVKVELALFGNISGAWYREARQEYPELFAEVNVDDPFFEQRRVAFTLDLDAVEIFDEAINFVTVEVRKQRSAGRDFHTSFTLTKDEIAANGTSRTITYAKMRDDSPEVFDYLVRWSLRGGVEWPANPTWTRGEWEGVTLAPPVLPLNVEVEADLAELEELGITRATVEVRYRQFGKDVTDSRALALSPAKGEPLAAMMIFRDRNDTGWQYRTNFYHKRLGRQQGGWQRGGEDGYVYCTVPETLRLEAAVADAIPAVP
ncbi:MAG TPA: hypothetical protein PLS95_18600 [Thermoanaerobaculales bacterium]|nr:hypothetical protein [Thermoanaerobaculales bacterium]HQN95027.1 hypothetical protein [Thermoanaerobaculales bacterium]HQP44169.1 hypothetical protein [Thermoanaerobaculales bacterium]